MRKFYWYFTAYLKKHGFIVITSVIVAVIFFWFVIPPLLDNLAVSQRHYVAIIGEYSLTDLPDQVKNQLSMGLTATNPDGSVSPGLAERWTTEQDGKTYRFVLKKNLFWQDGTPVIPSDIQYSLPEVETIITPNDIVFKLPAQYAPFPNSVTEPVLKTGTLKHLFFVSQPTIIGISQYKISSYKRLGTRLKELVIDGDNERYIYRFYQTEDDAIVAFKRGEVDTINNLGREHDIFNWPSVDVKKTLNKQQYLALFFNTRLPVFTKNIRQAISYAIEKKQGEERAVGPISPNSWGYLPGGKTYDQDWARGSERILDELPHDPLNLEITTTTLFTQQAEDIKKQLEDFGQKVAQDCQSSSQVKEKDLCENVKIKVAIKVNNFPDTSNYQMLLVGQEAPADPDQYSLWHSGESTNFTGYKNTRIDNLLEKGRQTYDQKDRTEIYQEFQQFFLEDPPAVFLSYLWNYDASRKSKL